MKVELPCEIGDTAYYIDVLDEKVVKSRVKEVSISITPTHIRTRVLFFQGDGISKVLGIDAFLTSEEAERELIEAKKMWRINEQIDKEQSKS